MLGNREMSSSDSITLGELWAWIRPLRAALVVGLALGGIAGWSVTSLMRPVYRAQTAIVPAKSSEGSGGLGGLANQIGGLAALAGIDFASSDGKEASLEFLKSKALAAKVIETHDLLPPLFLMQWAECK